MKTAEDYLTHMLGVKLETIQNNPTATVTVEEALAMCNAFSNQQLAEYKAKEAERIKDECIAFANWLSNTVVAGRNIQKLWKDYQDELGPIL